MHGELLKVFCGRCGWKRGWQGDLTGSDPCPSCERTHTLRPDIVWFGEIPYRMDEIEDVLMRAEVFAAIGTSGHVYPAAGFVSLARFHGAATIEINAQGTQVSGQFDRHLVGPATVEVARWVEECLG